MSSTGAVQAGVFCADVTPPVGHPLCAGWKESALGITDPLLAKGIILGGGEYPVVLLAIDWCEISNRSYMEWRRQLAEAVGTLPCYVTVHCVHPHCTPWPDEVAAGLVAGQERVRPLMDVAWCAEALKNVAAAARGASYHLQPVTHLTTGRAKVEMVASNRRVAGSDGKIKAVRWTTTLDPAVRAEPEGLIDPWLKTIGLWNADTKLAALHYYAVHPSSYEDRFVTPDFSGLARERRQAEDGGIPHLYFTECAGNITAGKYNDGSHENREIFTERVHSAMVESEREAKRVPLYGFEWKYVGVNLPPRHDMTEERLQTELRNDELHSALRSRAALQLAYLERGDTPIEISALHFDDTASLVNLPGESFIEYQLFAQEIRPSALVAAPSYTDCGPGYICMEASAEEGGYEPTDSFVDGSSEGIMREAIVQVMK